MEQLLFRELGLTERETRVYLALLELGTSTTGPIASRSGLPRSKVYEALEGLMRKGLSSYIVVSKTRHFEATNPKELLTLLDERKRRLARFLSELEQKQRFAKEKQIATVHEGFKAVRSLFNRIVDELASGDFYYAFALKEMYKTRAVPLFFRAVHRKLAEKKIVDRALANTSIRKEITHTYKDNHHIRIRFVRRSTPIGVVIVKNKVIQLVWGDLPTAIEISSAAIHQHYKQFFEELWKEAK